MALRLRDCICVLTNGLTAELLDESGKPRRRTCFARAAINTPRAD
jgi:hypothetical protein